LSVALVGELSTNTNNIKSMYPNTAQSKLRKTPRGMLSCPAQLLAVILLIAGCAQPEVQAPRENQDPVAQGAEYTTPEDAALVINLEASDPDGDSLRFTVVTKPSNGTVSGEPPALSYTPAQNFNGEDSFSFKVSDGISESNPATISIRVLSVNDPPVVTGSRSVTNEDTPATMTLDVTSLEGAQITFRVVEKPENGNVTIKDSEATYTPNKDFFGNDGFSFVANNGIGDSNKARVNITVKPVNDAPVVESVSATTSEDKPVTIKIPMSDPEKKPVRLKLVVPPVNGKVTITNDEALYVPVKDFYGTDKFVYTASDGESSSLPAQAVIQISPVNDPPVSISEKKATNEDTPLTIHLRATDQEKGSISYRIKTEPGHGKLLISGNKAEYTPGKDYHGQDAFTFIANDGTSDSNEATISITVLPVADIPTANNASAETEEDKPVIIPLVSEDIEGSNLVFKVVSMPANGTASISQDGKATYVPKQNFHGTDGFTFSVNNGQAESTPAKVLVSVKPVNDPPVSTSVEITTLEDTPSAGVTPDVQDFDPEDKHTFSIEKQPSQGSASVEDNRLIYTPAQNFFGEDGFTYKATDSGGLSVLGNARVIINPVNDPPEAHGGEATVNEDGTVEIQLKAVDLENTQFTFSIQEPPKHGSLTIAGARAVYTPNANYHGTDTFTYIAGDGTAHSEPARVDIKIHELNDAPSATSAVIETEEDKPSEPVTPVVRDLEDKDTHTFSIATQPRHGEALIVANKLVYKPQQNFSGSDSFTYTATDNGGLSVVGIATVKVRPVNDVPVAVGKKVQTNEDNPITIQLEGRDPEKAPLTLTIASKPSHGTVTFTGTMAIYTPASDFSGDDSFTFTVTDGQHVSQPAMVSINVLAVNDAPIATAVTTRTNEDTPVSIKLNATDAEKEGLIFKVVREPTHGTVKIDGNTAEYIPALNFNGVDSFTFLATDGGGANSNPVAANINVIAVDDPPIATGGQITTSEDAPVSIPLVVDDPEKSEVTISISNKPKNGTVELMGNRAVYTPRKDYFGGDSFSFQANDGKQKSNTGTIDITVTSVNDPPELEPIKLKTREDEPLEHKLAPRDSEGGNITYRVATPAANGNVTITDGVARYVPNQDFYGKDSFVIIASDIGVEGSVGGQPVESLPTMVSLDILPVNDPPVANDMKVVTNEDTSKLINLRGVDTERARLKYAIKKKPQNGALEQNGAVITYVPKPNYNGPDSFSYAASDGLSESQEANVEINVASVPDPPVSTKVVINTMEDKAASPVAPVVVEVDPDPNLIHTIASKPVNGKAAVVGNKIVYTPNPNFFGADNFTIKTTNSHGLSVVGSATVQVKSVNDVPLITGAPPMLIKEHEPFSFAPKAEDVENDKLTFFISGRPAWASFDPDTGVLSGTPGSKDVGVYHRIVISVSDGQSIRPVALPPFNLTVENVNDAPVADAGGLVRVSRNDLVSLDGTRSTDADPEDRLTFAWKQKSGAVQVVLENPTSPTPSFTAPDQDMEISFELVVSDGVLSSAPVEVKVFVSAWKAIAAGDDHTLGLRTDGTMWAWGYNLNGQLGDGRKKVYQPQPVQIGTDADWKAITAGGAHSLALKNDGTLWVWGKNNLGQLGLGDSGERHVPVKIGEAKDWVAIAAGGSYSVGLKKNGTLWAWGNNVSGQLGDGTTRRRSTPVKVGQSNDWKAVSASMSVTAAMKSNGEIWAWGYNGKLSKNQAQAKEEYSPRLVGSSKELKTFTTGQHHLVGLAGDGNLYSWLHSPGTKPKKKNGTPDKPEKVGLQEGPSWVQVSSNRSKYLGLRTDGSIWTWKAPVKSGKNGDVPNKHYPVQVGLDADWAGISCGINHFLALKKDGSLWSWGGNYYGQLGDGTTIDKAHQVKVAIYSR